MGKRSALVVLSSDDEEIDRSLSSNRGRTRSSSASRLISSAPAKNPGRAKKARVSGSRSSLGSVSTNWDEVRLSFGDFDEVFSGGSKVAAGSGRSNVKELWVEKYKPHSLEELAVHKKKVQEVKGWFEERLTDSKGKSSNHALVITGQAGVGKSATIHVIASQLAATLCEWNTPTPIVWQEHLYNSSTGVQYMSKLEEFENFVERVRKYGLIPSSLSEGSKSSIILLIDDLPVTNGKVAFQRLQKCLRLLVQSTRTPTAILITDHGKADSEDHTAGYLDELQLSLQSAGACKVSFNPITSNSIKKVLSRICKEEQCNVTAEQVDLIAKASGGDIRNAITSLQFFFLKPTPMHSLPSSITPPRYAKGKQAPWSAKGKSDMVNALDNSGSLQFGRDDTLSLFHALGKFLHNKRETEDSMELDGAAFHVREGLSRLPLKMDAPEKILCQAHGQARPIADFLHENVLDFVSEEAMDDAWSVASYLSDADLLLTTFCGMLSRQYEAENVLQSAGASVAVRGVLFGNFHPLPSRWHAVRRPNLWQVEKSSFYNKKEMVNRRFGAYSGTCSSDLTVIATEYSPVYKWLGFRAQGGLEDNVERMSLGDQESEIDDDIEEW
ncbi:putative checkpoint protein Rad17/Rad24 [Rosa chinensis]|uniref:Putative checkpoint protein Rad17/Rad24 n=1 Tax=Rosa chinensis TaxID=74649 RepID=A0A2P6RLS0_ROSCH|nr:cell cycle checkpoint protein RAD17 isoform X1 [Rosa chinensis]XP_024181650.1 cell cycle checkpoint protein RAD17 isoform X1 [Rosa chinensis]XP_024181651.1 cell cycle checkpoint protein RAD17 isoform X1 [Rosa chinensis]XP_024181652.1 cell cycle checkpoint protein RAD17 isoform X1 [Rosa chinensis]PRQ47378.1 putative checkpoint protein Rad17/Rad24 [Rosa chinensis]